MKMQDQHPPCLFLLENKKIMEKQKKNQDAAPMKTRTLKTHARNGKQD